MGSLLLKIGRWGHLVERNTRQLAAADAHPERCYEVHAGDIRTLPDFRAVAGGRYTWPWRWARSTSR